MHIIKNADEYSLEKREKVCVCVCSERTQQSIVNTESKI